MSILSEQENAPYLDFGDEYEFEEDYDDYGDYDDFFDNHSFFDYFGDGDRF